MSPWIDRNGVSVEFFMALTGLVLAVAVIASASPTDVAGSLPAASDEPTWKAKRSSKDAYT